MNLNIVEPGKGVSSKAVELSETTFGRDFNEALVHQVVTAVMAGARQGTRAQKNRSAASGGGRKPFRQKGTGRARAGTIRSPLWRGGGVTFANQTQDFSQKVNRKMYRGAMKSILSELIRQERLLVAEDFSVSAPRTKEVVSRLRELELDNVLVVVEDVDDNLFLGSRNLKNVAVIDVEGVNPVDLIGFDKVLFTVGALKKAEEMLA